MAPPAAPPNIHPAVWDDWRSAVFKESGVPLMFNRYTWMQIRDLNIRDGTSTFEDSHGPKDQNYFTWDSNSLFGALRDKALKTFPARLVVGSKLKRQVYGEVPPPIMWDDSEISDLATDNGKISFISGPYWNSKSWRNQLLRTLTAAKIEKEDPPSSSLPPMGAISLTNSQQSMVENSNCACIIPGTFDQSTLASDASSSFTAGYTPINSVRSGGPEPAHTPSCPNLEPVAPLLLENDNTNFRIKPHLLTTSNIVPIWPCDIFTWPSIRKNPTLHILVEISEGSTKFSGLLSDRRQALITKIVESIPRTMCHQTGQVADIPHWKEVKVEVLYFDPPAAQLMHSEDFYTQISNYLKSVASEICATPTTTSDGERDRSSGILNEWMDFQLLSCFTDNEWKYMPIWAGGEDDGSGAIFGQMMKTLVVGGDAPPNPTRNNNYHKAKDDDDDPDDLYTVLASVSDSQGSTVVLTDDDIKSEGTELGVWSIDGSTTMSETGDHDWEKIGIDEDGDNYGKNSIARGAMTPRENDVIMDDNDGVESTGAGKVNEDGVTDEDMEWDYDNEDDDEEDAGWDDEF